MKKSFMFAVALFALLLCPALALAEGELKKLPAPDTTGGKPLMSALAARHASRSFSSEPLTDKLISDMLWAGYGINRENGRRTAPSAKNVQDIEIYIMLPDGAWIYEPKSHALKQVVAKDFREMAMPAPAVLLYVADTTKSIDAMTMAIHTGAILQNVGLFCASAGLNNVVSQRFDSNALSKALNLPNTKKIMISQSVGRP